MTDATISQARTAAVRREVRQPLDPGPTLSPARTLWMYLKTHRSRLLMGALLTISGAFVSVLPPVLIGQIVDSLNQPDLNVIIGLGIGVVALTVVQGLFQGSGRYLTVSTARDVEYEMRDDLFHHLQRLDLAYFQHHRIGDLMARMTNDLNAVRMMLAMGQANSTSTAAIVAFAVVAMISVSVPLTLVSIVTLPFVTLTLAVIGRMVNKRFEDLQGKFGDISTAAQENLSGIRVVKAFAQEKEEVASFRQVCNQYLAGAMHLAWPEQAIWPLMEAILGVATLVVVIVGGIQAMHGQITLGQLVQFVAYLRLLSFPLISMGFVTTVVQSGWASLKRLQELWIARPTITDAPEPSGQPINGAIEFRDVTFGYGTTEVLRNVSFVVPAGTSVAVVGATGAGKSSLVNLIPRLFDVTGGQVLVDGMDVRQHSLSVLRQAIGYVPQETFLFSMPLRTNVGFGHTHDLSEEDLLEAGGISQLNADVATFPDQYDTVIGERGVTLSGGQKQRTALARAIAKDPRILILDDSFSAVDTHTEAQILHGLAGVRQGRTTVLVSHRVSTVKDCDQILVLANGGIAERGTHKELIAADGLYAEMSRRQQLEEEVSGDTGEAGIASPEAVS